MLAGLEGISVADQQPIFITAEGIKRAVEHGENNQLEFKSRLPPQPVLSSTVAAFANTKGGTILIGIDEEQGIVGVPDEYVEPQLDRLSKIAGSATTTVTGYGVQQVDGKNVLWVSVDPVPPHSPPILTPRGEFFTRQGTTIVREAVPQEKLLQIPKHGVATPEEDRSRLFVAISFREEEEPALVDYYQAIVRATESTKLPIEVTRVDLIEGDYEISQQIMDEIDKASIVLADFTLSPQNVYFEVGYARGKEKRILQTARKGTELSFDVRNWKTIIYRNATELEERLKGAIQVAYNELMQSS